MENNTTRYEGRLSSEVRVQLTDLVEAAAIAHMGKRPYIRKLCSIAIEMLDNAKRYCSDGTVKFSWVLQGDQVVITIQNEASEADARRLLGRVEAVNNMSHAEITSAFKAQLTNGEFGEKGGAGLGLLDIARRSAGTLHASIHPLGNDLFVCISSVTTTIQ